jgi:CHAT domain-containing protein/tetratricopeptide (TPR) repeat protein
LACFLYLATPLFILNSHAMNTFTRLVFLYIFLLFSGFFGSHPGLAQPAVPHETVRAKELLNQAAAEMDYGRYAEALALAREAEQQLRQVFAEEDARLAAAYCAAGLAAIQVDPDASGHYLQKALALELSDDDPAWVELLLFQGLYASRLQGQHEEALRYFEAALVRFRKVGGSPASEGSIHLAIGFAWLLQARYAESIAQNQAAIQVWSDAYGPDYPRLAHAYNNIGYAYFQGLGQPQRALEYHQRTRALRERLLGAEHLEVAASLINIGLAYNALGDYDYATVYLYRALSIAREEGQQAYLAAIYTNLGVASSGRKEHTQAREYYQKVLKIEESLYGRPDHPEILTTLHNLAVSYKDEGQFDVAAHYYQRALDAAAPDHSDRCQFINGLGLTQLATQRYAEAEVSFRRSLEAALRTYSPRHPHVANAYYNLGNLAMVQDRVAVALDWNQQALGALGYRGGGSREGISSDLYLVNTLSQRCSLLWEQVKMSRRGDMNELLATCQALFDIFEQVSRTYRRASSRQELMEQVYPVFEIAIAAYLRRYQQTGSAGDFAAALAYAERSKAVLLYEALLEAEAQQIAGIPHYLLQQENELRDSLAHYETLRQSLFAAGNKEDDPALLAIAGKIRRIDDQYERLLAVYEEQYPRYFLAKHQQVAPRLETIQRELLRPGQSLVEYVVGEKHLYIFWVQPDAYDAVIVPKEELEIWVRQMMQEGLAGAGSRSRGKQGFELETASNDSFTAAAQQLYAKLWQPIHGKLGELVIIIPDGVLGYVPFEALISGKPPREGIFWSYPFLLRDHCITYAPSAALLREMRQPPRPASATSGMLALAPFHSPDELVEWIEGYAGLYRPSRPGTLAGLPGSKDEAGQVAALWGGQAYYGTEASIELFRHSAAQYRYLHIATHGQADDRRGDYAYLAFGVPGQQGYYTKFYAREIYTLSLDAELVFLSACETGLGRLRRGEGIISLARAFAYAGAHGIVNSLWQVKDYSTTEVAQDFYAHLKAGMGKAEALRQAKLDYLEKYSGSGQKAHPYYWAGLIGLGDMR